MFLPRLVLIDDHPAVQHALAFVLGDAFEVIVHPRAAGAVAVIRQVQPALALIDLHLEYPLAGLDVVRALRAAAATLALPLIVWSSDPVVEQQVAALGLADVAVVSKQDGVTVLRAALERALTVPRDEGYT